MRSIGRLFVVVVLASCAVGVLWLAVRSQAISLPEPACADRGPAGGDVSAAGSISAYLPLVARDATVPYTFSLPSNLPAVEALYPLTDAARARLQEHGFVVLGAESERYLSRAYIRIAWEPEVLVLEVPLVSF